MNMLDASLEALEIFNLGLIYVYHYAKAGENQKARLKVNMRGTIDRLETLLEKMDE
jgi:hypothetical protein